MSNFQATRLQKIARDTRSSLENLRLARQISPSLKGVFWHSLQPSSLDPSFAVAGADNLYGYGNRSARIGHGYIAIALTILIALQPALRASSSHLDRCVRLTRWSMKSRFGIGDHGPKRAKHARPPWYFCLLGHCPPAARTNWIDHLAATIYRETRRRSARSP